MSKGIDPITAGVYLSQDEEGRRRMANDFTNAYGCVLLLAGVAALIGIIVIAIVKS